MIHGQVAYDYILSLIHTTWPFAAGPSWARPGLHGAPETRLHIFFGEEISMAARLFTNGWDLFNPTKTDGVAVRSGPGTERSCEAIFESGSLFSRVPERA